MIKAAFTVAGLKLLRSTTRAVILDPGIFLQAFYGETQHYTSRERAPQNLVIIAASSLVYIGETFKGTISIFKRNKVQRLYFTGEDWQGNIKLEIKKIRLQIIEHKLLVLGMCP